MRDKQCDRFDSPKSDNGEGALSTLESAESYVAASTATGAGSDGGRAAFSASFATLLDWGEEVGLIRPIEDFPFFCRPTDGHGDEHEAWFDAPSSRWYKSTYPNKFGLAWGRNGSATAGEYLTRLVLQNRYFADEIRLIALVR